MKTTSSVPFFLHHRSLSVAGALCAFIALRCQAQPDPNWIDHDRDRPMPPLVTPATPSTPEQVGKAPSDAVVLFDGKDISQWCAMDGSPSKWIVKDGYMECVKGSGYIRTLRNFGDCQYHIEWATPTPGHGEGQGRGNSGVFFGLDRYEVQVLDSFEAKGETRTYADGSAGSAYGQYPPLVNACRAPGEWQTYDIIYTAPRFDADGKVLSPTRLTVFHNGVLIQNNIELTGPTGWINRVPYAPHPEKQPLSLQDHGNPVRFRNIWVRELGKPGKPEHTFAASVLENYIGTYGQIEIAWKAGVRGNPLVAKIGGQLVTLYAESKTKFFGKSTDVQIEFKPDADGKVNEIIWSVGEGANPAKRK